MKNKIGFIFILCIYIMSCSNGSSGHVPNIAQPPGGIYQKLSAGTAHTCAINPSAQLKCWGRNQSGQLGDGTTVDKSVSTFVDVATSYADVSTGDAHTCGVTTAGVLKCWGQNSSGQLGDGTTTDQILPIVIDAGISYSQVSVSGSLSCAITTAGVLKCWGNNNYGQIGDGTSGTGAARAVPVIISAGTSFSDISTGYVHTCAVAMATSNLYCWGYNFFSQLGDYTSTTRLVPVQADTGFVYSKVVASNNYTCGLTTANNLRCWGRNDYGQLGDGSIVDRYVPIGISRVPLAL